MPTLGYSQAAAKGRELRRQLLTNPTRPPSKPSSSTRSSKYLFLQYDQLHKHGWQLKLRSQRPPQDEPQATLYRDLRLSSDADDNTFFAWEHLEASRPKARPFQPTTARFHFILNPRAVIVLYSEGPAHTKVGKGLYERDVVPLRFWSNVVFLQWQEHCARRGLPINGLRHIIVENIENEATQDIMREISLRYGLPIRQWNRMSMTMPLDDQGGYDAILGTPTGTGPAQLLLQHRDQLGSMYISSVNFYIKRDQIFHKDELYLCFNLKPCEW